MDKQAESELTSYTWYQYVLLCFATLSLLVGFIWINMSLFQQVKATGGLSTIEAMQLEKIKNSQRLVIRVINSPFTLTHSEYSAGFNADLAKEFANSLGVELDFKHVNVLNENMEGVDIIIGQSMPEYEWRPGPVLYTQHFQLVSLQSIMSKLATPIRQSEVDLAISHVVKNHSNVGRLLNPIENSGYLLESKIPDLRFDDVQAYPEGNPFFPLIALIKGEQDFAIVDSISAAIFRRIYPDLKIVENVTENENVTWYFKTYEHDQSLYLAFKQFHQRPSTYELLEKLSDKYFNSITPFDRVETYRFIRATQNILPKYKSLFKSYAKEFDWRLIAAMAFQESQWDPSAKSPTGVRGMMMLTRDTAEFFDIDDRLDTEKSIAGGVEYLRFLLQRIPNTIDEDERIWFALAAYNMGIGHLWDARELTLTRGGNPDRWHDVKQNLPLLREEAVYSQLNYGFARGDEALIYVENIRRYYTSLLGLDAIKELFQPLTDPISSESS